MTPLPRRDVKALVRQLGADSRPAQKAQALATLRSLCAAGNAETWTSITAAGAVPSLVRLLRSGAAISERVSAMQTLEFLSEISEHTSEIAEAGAIPLLVQLLGPDTAAHIQESAAKVLSCLASNTDHAIKIAAAGAIPILVHLLGPGSSAGVHRWAAASLANMSRNADDNVGGRPRGRGHHGHVVSIALAGALPRLVQLLGAGSGAEVQEAAADTLAHCATNAWNAAATVIAGGIPQLVRLLGPRSPPAVQQSAAVALTNIAYDNDDNKSTMIENGLIPPLVQLLGCADPPQLSALQLVSFLSYSYASAMAAAGAIPLLVHLMGPGSSFDTRQCAAGALLNFARIDDLAGSVAAAGAIPHLVQLLEQGSTSDQRAQESATRVLSLLAQTDDSTATTIGASGAIPQIVRLLGPRSTLDVQFAAAKALWVMAGKADVAVVISAAGAMAALMRLVECSPPFSQVQQYAGAAMSLLDQKGLGI
jgi:vacuolar protein 8